MIRIIVRETDTSFACNVGGPGTSADVHYKTFDIDAPGLEGYLREFGPGQLVDRVVIGAELIHPASAGDQKDGGG